MNYLVMGPDDVVEALAWASRDFDTARPVVYARFSVFPEI